MRNSNVESLVARKNGVVDVPFADLFAWGARRTFGTFFELQFGEPYLEVLEPRPAAPRQSGAGMTKPRRRRVEPRGTWTIWVKSSSWEVVHRTQRLASSDDSSEHIQSALDLVNGLKFLEIRVSSKQSRTTLSFEDGHKIVIRRVASDDGQWAIFRRGHCIASMLDESGLWIEP